MRFRRIGRDFASKLVSIRIHLSPNGKIILGVLLAHATILIWALCSNAQTLSPPETKRLTVRMVTPAPHLPSKQTALSQKKRPLPSKKRKPQRDVAQKSIKKNEKLLADLEKCIDSLNFSESPKQKRDVFVPSHLQASSIEESTQTCKKTRLYIASFMQTLQTKLDLPERGAVKIRLSIDPTGKITSFELLDAQSTKNADWLKKQLPQLQLPCFNEFGIAEPTVVFTVTFHNAESL